MARNRRRDPRVRTRDLAAQLLTGRGRTPAQVENISRGGVFVRTDAPLEVGSDLMIELVRPGLRKVLGLAAKVTSRIDPVSARLSRRAPGMGLQFIGLDARQTERLATLLQDLGATGIDGEVTLGETRAEPELRALQTRADPEPRPAVRAEPELRALQTRAPPSAPIPAKPRSGPLDLPRGLASDIEGALRDADLPASAPLDGRASRRIAPPPVPAVPPPAPDEAKKLSLQLRGLVMQLSDVQGQLSTRDLEIERLREEVEARDALIAKLRAELEAAKSR